MTLAEKAFMKLWNRWVLRHPPRGDREVPAACWRFVRDERARLRAGGLRHNLLVHLFHLWDNSLVSAAHVTNVMAAYDADE